MNERRGFIARALGLLGAPLTAEAKQATSAHAQQVDWWT